MGASGSLPPDPDGDAGDPGPATDSDDAADSLLVEAANSLERATPASFPPGASGPAPGPRGPVLASGTLIMDRYRLDRRLGEGGMGEVWAATHAITRRRVAMKFLKATATMRPEMRQRFLREARAASLVQHPSVVDVLDAFELEGGVPVMVMDLLVGETLGARLARDGVLPARELAALLLPAVEAVEAAHAIGIVHRDLKPENIFLTSTKAGGVAVKVLDFGIAKLTAREGDAAETGAITGTGSVIGTPWYMAPEQCYGEKDVDARADVWALGVILYECLSGERPVAGDNVGQLVKAMLDDRIVPIEQRAAGLAPELSRLVGQMLSRDRNDRPQSVTRVREVLAALAGGRAPARSETGGAHALPGPRASRPGGARRIPAAALLVAAVGVAGWGVVRFSRPASTLAGPPPAETPATQGPPAAALPSPTASAAPVDSARSDEPPAPRPVHARVHAAVATAKAAPASAPTTKAALAVSEHPTPPAPSASEGGLFRQIPF